LKIRFQADADFNRHIIAAIKRREPTISFQLHMKPDSLVLKTRMY